MIKRKLYYWTQTAQSWPWISCVSHVKSIVDKKDYVSSASYWFSYFAILERIESILNGYIFKYLLALLGAQNIVQLLKSYL